jgi:hypothetical protein
MTHKQEFKPIKSMHPPKQSPEEIKDNLYQNATAISLEKAFQFCLSGKAKGEMTIKDVLSVAQDIKSYLVNYTPKIVS